MNVLVACEECQEVCKAFRARGHNAFSCDIQEQSGGHPEWHIQDDVLPYLNGKRGACRWFYTEDGQEHNMPERWDLIIAHPPCTRLCSSGQRWLYYGDEEYREKKRKDQKEAIKFFLAFTDADCDRIAIENPVGIMSKLYRKPDCIYNPYDFAGEIEPEEIEDRQDVCLWIPEDRFAEIIKAEAEGQLVILPFKVGDTVYYLNPFDEIEIGKITMIQQKADGTWKFRVTTSFSRDVTIDAIGKTVFLTREEAEAALKGET